ncbi:mille-pattes peptide 3 [Tribolium castaneum]|uniref:Mlpt peptide 3 n=1 Tax=Tribolium castaneum TaxID=7070 RepID=Q0VU41_TRICA|nr:mille-pattes peptide 3 [Tribolium castaneum]CAK30050.1 mlpt peptide 3 [Tribolium castaneum]|eukprot:NP_001127954.1 mille-pattes peptide 3 [Tribolium castaneum]
MKLNGGKSLDPTGLY